VSRAASTFGCALAATLCVAFDAWGQTQRPASDVRLGPLQYYGGKPPVDDDPIFFHGILDQAEARFNGRNIDGRWEGQAWAGTDYNKIWVKSEGLLSKNGKIEDGQNQILYARSISTYFDLQAGLRVDANSSTTSRTWGAFGIQGLSMYFFDLEATGFVSDRGTFAAKLAASYDLLFTQRLILQPQVELNLYSQATPSLLYGSGFSSMEAGIRLRYEITRKFAPYIGIHYEGKFGQTATLVKQEGERPTSVGFVFGIRSWF
jgi:copper resistance protein B